jgi:hypothetical protein
MGRNQTASRAKGTRLEPGELSVFLESCPPGTAGIVRALRAMIRRCAPGTAEAIRFHSICYFLAEARFGSIGGNICMIEDRPNTVRLSFLHGAALTDPAGLLRGEGKAKRFVDIASMAEARRPALGALVKRAAERAKNEVRSSPK